MFLRALIVCPPGDLRRKAARAASRIESLVSEAGGVQDMRLELSRKPFDLVLIHRGLLGAAAAKGVAEIRGMPESPEVIVLCEDSGEDERAELVAAGCLGVVPESIEGDAFFETLTALAERRRVLAQGRLRHVPAEDYRLGDYACISPVMHDFLSQARRVANRDSTLLILGETGVGKGLLARSIHNEGPRSEAPFVSVNCGALTESLLESELFGHEKGAFTGANRARRGHFELAHGGTIFLDEISELPLHLQVKMLRILEDCMVQPVGSERSIRVDLRIIAATNRDLAEEVEAGRFRKDLFYRLSVVTLTMPPLRERREDIPELVQSYVDHFCDTLNTHVTRVHPDVVDLLTRYDWPGNVRELINAIERAVIMCEADELHAEDLPLDIQGAVLGGAIATPRREGGLDASPVRVRDEWLELPWADVRGLLLAEAERHYLVALLETHHGRIGEAAAHAGLNPRSLYDKLRKHGIRKEDFRRPARSGDPVGGTVLEGDFRRRGRPGA